MSVREIVQRHALALPPEVVAALESELIEREDAMADIIRLAGAQFGLFPFIVSEVLAQVGLGTPLTDTESEFIHRQYVEGMEELARQAREAEEG